MKEEQTLKETLSAWLDGEAGKIDQLELRRLARALDDQPELVETCRRYTLARAALRGEYWPSDSKQFVEKLRAELESAAMDEMADVPDRSAGAGRRYSAWLPFAGRVAIAASVAVLTISLFELTGRTNPEAPAVVASAVAASRPPAPTTQHSTRLIAPEVITVGTGSHAPVTLAPSDKTGMVDCIIGEPQLARRELVWEKALPAGYSLCRQSAGQTACEPVATAISCYRQ